MAKFFQPLRDLVNVFLKIDFDQLAFDIASNKDFQTLVIQLNTEDQLFEQGEDSTGKSLESIGGAYSPFTVELKKQKGQPTDRVTLKDTGSFYMSFEITPFQGGFRIDADPIKDNTNLFDEWGEDIVGLNDENLQIVIEFYKNAIIQELQKRLVKP